MFKKDNVTISATASTATSTDYSVAVNGELYELRIHRGTLSTTSNFAFATTAGVALCARISTGESHWSLRPVADAHSAAGTVIQSTSLMAARFVLASERVKVNVTDSTAGSGSIDVIWKGLGGAST